MPNVRDYVLKAVSELESFDVPETVLHVRVHNELDHAKDLSTQVECITEATLLALLCRESLDRLQVEVVVQMQEVQVLAMDEQIEHVVALPADLQSCFNPVKLCQLEELRLLEGAEQIALVLRLWLLVVKAV